MPIIDRRTRLKARRAIRQQRRQMEAVTAQADDNINRHVLRRFGRLVEVRRFVIIWVALILLLGIGALWQVRGMDKYYLETKPVAGGTYREGIIGSFTNASPLFATSSVDSAVSRLVFSGLFKVSPEGKVLGDLATKLDVDEEGKIYTVTLRENVRWHDGESFNADDVVFTYKAIQDRETRSPLRSSWEGVKIKKINDYKVTFEITNALSSFSYALVNGIVPEHILANVPNAELRSSNFNTINPIGTGSFKLKTLDVVGQDVSSRQERVALTKYSDYHEANNGPENIVIRTYRDDDAMLNDFEAQIIQSMVGLGFMPDNLLEKDDVRALTVPLTSAVMAFFNNSAPVLSDAKVRQALVQGVDSNAIRKGLSVSSIAVDSPFLKSHFAYNPDIVQLPYDKTKALALLDEAGWTLNEQGIRTKDGKELKLRLVSQSLSEYSAITKELQKSWSELGIAVDAVLQPEEDIQAGAIARHDYDVLLYGISIGYDPDVFAYWHSSQFDPNATSRLNFSEYQNEAADSALEAGRTRLDEELRKVKYQPFLQAWRDDAPAVAFYQPNFTMIVRGTFEGFEGGQLSTATDRFYSVGEWKIRNDTVIKDDIDE